MRLQKQYQTIWSIWYFGFKL